MNILLTTFFYNDIPFTSFYDHMCGWLVNNMSQDKINVKFIITSDYFETAVSNFKLENYNPILFSKENFEYVFNDNNFSIINISNKVLTNTLSQNEKQLLSEILKNNLGDWCPDIIVSQGHISGKNIFGDIFPNALCLSTENAIFSRPPFSRTLSYDPYTSVPDNFPVRFADKIKQFEITEEDNLKIEKLKKAITGIVDKYNKLDDEMMFYYKQKFDKLVLLPLVGDKYIKLFKDCIFDSELELVERVMEKTPKNVGVFVTQADAYASLTPENIEYFSNKYSNFIYLQKTNERGYANNSLNYFKYIDAVFNITSKTAFMAMLWDKPVLSLSKQFNNWFKDVQGLDDIDEVLYTPYKNKNNILYWYFTRYVTFEQDFPKENFLYNYLETKLEKYRKNDIKFEFFEEINSIDKVFDFLIQPVINYYENEKKKEIFILQNQNNALNSKIDDLSEINNVLNSKIDNLSKENSVLNSKVNSLSEVNNVLNSKIDYLISRANRATILQQIFSVRNEGAHKVLRILGIKIKCRRKIK